MKTLKYFLAAFFAAIIWGFFSMPLRHLKAYPAEEILYYRIFTSLIITLLLTVGFRRDKVQQDLAFIKALNTSQRRSLLGLTLLAGLLISGNWFTFIYAINNVSLKSAAFAYMVCPLITALGGYLILHEELSTKKFTSLGIALLSIIFLASGSFIEVMWSVVIAALYAFYLITQRKIRHLDKLNVLTVQLLISTLLVLPLFFSSAQAIPVSFSFWTDIFIISLVFTVIPLFLSLYALIGMQSSTLGVIIYINPIIAFTVAFFYFQEVIDTTQLIAYLMLLIAVIIFNWDLLVEIFSKRSKVYKEQQVI